jgi:hypothetical protein
MPAEKNAVFLPMQYGFKQKSQRVKEHMSTFCDKNINYFNVIADGR